MYFLMTSINYPIRRYLSNRLWTLSTWTCKCIIIWSWFTFLFFLERPVLQVNSKMKVNVIVSPFSCSRWAIGFVYLSMSSAIPGRLPYQNNSTEKKHVEMITITNNYRTILSQPIAEAHWKKVSTSALLFRASSVRTDLRSVLTDV